MSIRYEVRYGDHLIATNTDTVSRHDYARSARYDPPTTVGDYLGWTDPEHYCGSAGWQELHFDGSRWWHMVGNLRMVAFPEYWQSLPNDQR